MWLTAMVLGFAGSMHCMGMCSPLVMAVTSLKAGATINRLIYNAGRILTYAVMGAIVASAGMFLPFHRFQNIISVILGITLLAIAFGGIKNLKIPGLSAAVQHLSTRLKALFARQLSRKSRMAMFMMGGLNGLLPCGLTLMALTWCLSLRGPADGFTFMVLFGAGTLPVMLGFTGFLPVLINKLQWRLQHVTTAMLIMSGCVLILRALIVHAPHATTDQAGLIDIILCR